ncbi:response regulator [Candidatus Woesearchaeota archaeon]|nr:response regulator [Candidatus Woesearchaeota archaeon]
MTDIVVDMGSVALGYEHDNLISVGLGSCVGVALYDPEKKIGGMAHIMLPNSKEIPSQQIERKALIAEKDSKIRSSLKNTLAHLGFASITETEEKEGTLAKYKETSPSIAFISAFLPPTNGVDTAKAILSKEPNAPIVIMSPPTDRTTISYYSQEGAKEVMISPFTEERVRSVSEFILGINQLKFADKAIQVLVELMVNRGADKRRLVAKIAGGAHMFPTLMDEEVINIGNRNINISKKNLKEMGIPLEAEETGASIGRTVTLEVATGKLRIKTKDGIKEL